MPFLANQNIQNNNINKLIKKTENYEQEKNKRKA